MVVVREEFLSHAERDVRSRERRLLDANVVGGGDFQRTA